MAAVMTASQAQEPGPGAAPARKTFGSLNPATGQPIATFPVYQREDADVELTPAVGEWLVRSFDQVAGRGAPQPVLQLLTGAAQTGAALAASAVDKIAFTGSAATARKVMAIAAENLTPVIAECGGKDARLPASCRRPGALPNGSDGPPRSIGPPGGRLSPLVSGRSQPRRVMTENHSEWECFSMSIANPL